MSNPRKMGRTWVFHLINVPKFCVINPYITAQDKTKTRAEATKGSPISFICVLLAALKKRKINKIKRDMDKHAKNIIETVLNIETLVKDIFLNTSTKY